MISILTNCVIGQFEVRIDFALMTSPAVVGHCDIFNALKTKQKKSDWTFLTEM